MSITPRKITTGRSQIGHEQGVAHEHRVAHLVSHARRGVAGHVDRLGLQVPNGKRHPFFDKVIELASIQAKLRFKVEYFLEHTLHSGNVRADGYFSTQARAHIRRSRQVIGMGMGFQNPLNRQIHFLHESNDLIGGGRRRSPRFWIVIQHRINYCANGPGLFIRNISHRAGGVIIKAFNNRVHSAPSK